MESRVVSSGRACCEILPDRSAEMVGEGAVDERVRGGVEWRQALDERGCRDASLVLREVAVYLEEIEDKVRAPTQDKN